MNEYNGVAEDPRSPSEKAQDYKAEDLAMGDITINWIDYANKIIKSYPIQNQDGSSSCVAQGTSKILAIHEVLEGRSYQKLCPKFIYTRRQNYPDGGMWLPNALSLACKYGSCLEDEMPCDNKGESFMNDTNEHPILASHALEYRAKYYFEITDRAIDNIAKILEQSYGVLLGFRFDYDEWTNVPFINPTSKLSCGHGIAAIDYILYEGKKALIIEDSWGPDFGKGGRRIITEDFLNARCFYAGYITSLPNYIFTKVLRLGSKGIDVRKLQEKLGIKVDGIFGPKTKQAVIKFQQVNLLQADGVVGPKTNQALNQTL